MQSPPRRQFGSKNVFISSKTLLTSAVITDVTQIVREQSAVHNLNTRSTMILMKENAIFGAHCPIGENE